MLGVAPRSSRISLNVPVSSGRSEKTRHTNPLVMTGRSLPYRAVSDSTACPGVDAPGGATTGGTAANARCVNGAGKLGIETGPEGAGRLAALPGPGAQAGGPRGRVPR